MSVGDRSDRKMILEEQRELDQTKHSLQSLSSLTEAYDINLDKNRKGKKTSKN